MSFTNHMKNKAKELAELSIKPLDGYTYHNQDNKDKYLSVGRGVLRSIAKHYQLKEYKVNVNPAGIAVSGDITLIGMFNDHKGIYIHMSEPRLNFRSYSSPVFYFRSVSHIKDYSGGLNHWMTYTRLAQDLEAACDEMKRMVS